MVTRPLLIVGLLTTTSACSDASGMDDTSNSTDGETGDGTTSGSDESDGTDTGDDTDTGDTGADPGMVVVPAGPFSMGCDPVRDLECEEAAQPMHEVELDAFEVDVQEVTVADYAACVDAAACPAAGVGEGCNEGVAGRDDHPINCVSWIAADAYCTWTGKSLLTEAQWEKAARGDDARPYPWGSDLVSCEFAVVGTTPDDDGCGTGSTAPVGSRPAGASPYGVLDMAGNVLEYVADYFDADYYAMSPALNPTGPVNGSNHVARGSSWEMWQPVHSRTWKRWGTPADAESPGFGIRCGKPI